MASRCGNWSCCAVGLQNFFEPFEWLGLIQLVFDGFDHRFEAINAPTPSVRKRDGKGSSNVLKTISKINETTESDNPPNFVNFEIVLILLPNSATMSAVVRGHQQHEYAAQDSVDLSVFLGGDHSTTGLAPYVSQAAVEAAENHPRAPRHNQDSMFFIV